MSPRSDRLTQGLSAPLGNPCLAQRSPEAAAQSHVATHAYPEDIRGRAARRKGCGTISIVMWPGEGSSRSKCLQIVNGLTGCLLGAGANIRP